MAELDWLPRRCQAASLCRTVLSACLAALQTQVVPVSSHSMSDSPQLINSRSQKRRQRFRLPHRSTHKSKASVPSPSTAAAAAATAAAPVPAQAPQASEEMVCFICSKVWVIASLPLVSLSQVLCLFDAVELPGPHAHGEANAC